MTLPTPERPGIPLRVLGQDGGTDERSDAARNRRLLLAAATALVAEHGVAALTMDGLARRAGVGKGTVFRRFGSRAGLMLALLDHSEQEFQAAYLSGPPPLGPDADPVERLVAFGRARLDLILIQGELLEAASTGRHYATNVYRSDVTHVSMLLRQAGAPGFPRLLAAMLLATIDVSLILHQVRVEQVPLPDIAAHWELLVRRVTGPTPMASGVTTP